MPFRVAVIGRDAALWLTAAALTDALAQAGVTVTAVELPTRLTPASVYRALPAVEALHARLGLDEAALLRAAGGGYTLGWNVAGAGVAPFFLAHGAYGAPIEGRAFFPYWAKARRYGLAAAYEDFSPTAAAARQGRLLLPDDDTDAFGRADYGYHLPALGYCAALKTRAAQLGAALRRTVAIGVERGDAGIAAVSIDDGEHITADLYIDATGAEAALLGGERLSWRHLFPADRRLVARAPRFASLPIYGELRAAAGGWFALQASQLGTHVTYEFASGDRSDERAWQDAHTAAGMTLDDPAVMPLLQGRASRLWGGNCVAIGPAACAFDQVIDLELQGIQLGIVHLLSLFPADAPIGVEQAEYDRVVGSHFDRLRDVQLALHVLCRATGAFWDRARAMPLPSDLAHRIATFRARGTITPIEDDAFDADLWQALFTGLGEVPASWPPAIDRTAPEVMKAEFRRILGFVRDKVLDQPSHDDYLARTGARRS